MSRVITFSRTFPSYHPKKGKPTYFPEQLFNSLHRAAGVYFTNIYSLTDLNPGKEKQTEAFWKTVQTNYQYFGFKGHTIRAGHRWKVGDKFSPRVWSGKPYQSKMITIAPDIEVKKEWSIEINFISRPYFKINGVGMKDHQIDQLASNDGLSYDDMRAWFAQDYFKGQIICWDESIKY